MMPSVQQGRSPDSTKIRKLTRVVVLCLLLDEQMTRATSRFTQDQGAHHPPKNDVKSAQNKSTPTDELISWVQGTRSSSSRSIGSGPRSPRRQMHLSVCSVLDTLRITFGWVECFLILCEEQLSSDILDARTGQRLESACTKTMRMAAVHAGSILYRLGASRIPGLKCSC